MHNDSKSNPADEVSPRVRANTFIRNGLCNWVEGANFLLSLEPEWEDCAQEYVICQNLSLPPGLLTKKQHLFQEKTATSSVFWQMFSGVAGNKNTFLCCRSARNGSAQGENSLLETPLLSLMNQRPGVYGRLVESQTFFLGKNGFLRHFRVKIKTPALEQPITKLWLLESVAHWKWFVCFSELFKRLCATHWAFVIFYQTGHSSLFEALRPLWHLLLKQFILSVVYCLM